MVELQQSEQVRKRTLKWFQLTLIVATVLLGAGYIFKLLTPTQVQIQPTISENYKGSVTTFSKVTFIGIAPSLPEELPVATAENFTPIDPEDRSVKNQLIQQFNLKQHPQVASLWLSSQYGLQEIEAVGSFELTSQVDLIREKIVNQVEARQAAEEFVSSVFKNSSLQVLKQNIKYLEADVHGDVVEPEEAGILGIPFGYQINGYPVFLDRSLDYPVLVMVNAENQIQKAVFYPFFLDPKIDGQIKTIPISQAIANINSNRATIISSHYDGAEVESLDSIVSGALNTITIEYRISTDTKKIVPYYRFGGQLKNSIGQQFFAEIITPAVQTQDNQP